MPGGSAGCCGIPGTTTRPRRCGRKRPSRPPPSETPAGSLTHPDRRSAPRLVRRRRQSRAQRARAHHDPRVPQDRLSRRALDADTRELPARPRDALHQGLPADQPGRPARPEHQATGGHHARRAHVRRFLEAFIAEKPDFGRAATFYVLPGASKPNRLFNQPEYEGRKLQYLASHGYEIGNHTLWHANLAKYPEATVRAQVAEAQVWIQRHVPEYRTRTLALPHGAYPADVSWVLRGSAKGTTYRHDAVLKVGGGAAPSPFSRAFDPVRLPRIQAIERELVHWLGYFERNPGERFVSDGDPDTVTVPAALRDRLRSELPRRLRIVDR